MSHLHARIGVCMAELMMQGMSKCYSSLRQNQRYTKYAAVAAIAFGVCCSVALIQTCSHLCCGPNEDSSYHVKSSTLGEGFQTSIRNLAAASKQSQTRKGWRWLFAWGVPPQNEVRHTSLILSLCLIQTFSRKGLFTDVVSLTRILHLSDD